MQRVVLVVLFVVGCLLSAHAASYKLDESHSQLGFKIRHLGISTVHGHFAKFSGTGTYDEASGRVADVKVSIDATSINTNEPDRDKHLRSADFFDVEKYPAMTFESTEIEYEGKQPKKIKGKFTLHGVTKVIVFEITDWGGTATDPWGNERLAFEAQTQIDRTEYGLTWNKGLEKAAGLLVGNEVKLEILIEAMKVK